MREGRLQRDGVRLHYLEWGLEGGLEAARQPSVLLLHGLSSNARYWERVAARLPGRRLVALDQRSHGLSDRPAGANSMSELVADAAHAITELGLGRPVVVGHSWGAAVGLDLAGTRSDLVSGLVFIDGPGSPLSELMTWDQAAQLMQPPLPRYANLKEAIAEARRDLTEAWGPDLPEFVKAKLTLEGEALVLTLSETVRLEMLKGIYAFQPGLLWPQVGGPVTAIWARTAPAPIVSWKEGAAGLLRSLVPDAAIRWYEAPHDVPLYRPEEVAADIERLCRRVPWHQLAAEVQELEGDWSRPSGSEAWSAKDLLAHLTSTQAAVPGILSSTAQPPDPNRPAFDPDRWNASQVRRRLERSPEELKLEMAEATRALEAALVEADLDQVVTIGPYPGLSCAEGLERLVEHQRGHLAELRAALGAGVGDRVVGKQPA